MKLKQGNMIKDKTYHASSKNKQTTSERILLSRDWAPKARTMFLQMEWSGCRLEQRVIPDGAFPPL